MALTDRNFYSMLSEDGTGSYYGPTVFFTGDYGGGGSLFETPTFSYPTIVNPQQTFDYGDLTGDLEQVNRGGGIFDIGRYILPNIPGIDLRDEIGQDLSGPGYTTPSAVDTTTGETVFVETGAPITNYIVDNTTGTYVPVDTVGPTGTPITNYVVDSYVPGTGGETDLGGTTDYVYTPTIDTSTPINFVTPQRISEVQDLYRSLLGREAEPGAAEWWASTGVPINEISSAIYNSPEGLAYQQAQTIQYTGPSTIDTSQGTQVASVNIPGAGITESEDTARLGLNARENEQGDMGQIFTDELTGQDYVVRTIQSDKSWDNGNPVQYTITRNSTTGEIYYNLINPDGTFSEGTTFRPTIDNNGISFGDRNIDFSGQSKQTLVISSTRLGDVGTATQENNNTTTLTFNNDFINKDYTPDTNNIIKDVVANTIIAVDPSANTNVANEAAKNVVDQLQNDNVDTTNNSVVINTDTGNTSNAVPVSQVPNVITNIESNLAQIEANLAQTPGNVTVPLTDIVANANIANIPANVPATTSLFDTANVASNIGNNVGNQVINEIIANNQPILDLITGNTNQQGNNIVIDTNGIANVPANTAGNNISLFDSNISSNIPANVPTSGNVIIADTSSNVDGNIPTIVPGNANIITIDTGANANANANVLPIVPNANANVIPLDTGANANANVLPTVPEANLVPLDTGGNVDSNANVIVANVIQNNITSTNVADTDGNVANIANTGVIVNVANVANVANVTGTTTGPYQSLTGNLTINTGAGYLQPGLIAPTPFYQTTSPVQSQYSWGSRMLQPGPTFNEQYYNTMPNAPATPWGIQNIRTSSLTPEELADIFAGRTPKQQTFTQATPTNPNYRTVPQQLQAIQPTGQPYQLLPVLPIRPIASNLGKIGNANPNAYVTNTQAYDDYMALIQQGGM